MSGIWNFRSSKNLFLVASHLYRSNEYSSSRLEKVLNMFIFLSLSLRTISANNFNEIIFSIEKRIEKVGMIVTITAEVEEEVTVAVNIPEEIRAFGGRTSLMGCNRQQVRRLDRISDMMVSECYFKYP